MPPQFVFDCPACEAEVAVDAGIRSALLEDGCVRCRQSVTPDAFVRMADVDGPGDTGP
jgi:hypothetical protein